VVIIRHCSIMAVRGDNNFMRYVYMGQEGEFIPLGATHIIVHESVTVIRARAFRMHRNIVEVICHDNVEKMKESAFYKCRSLKRVIMPGVTIVEEVAFYSCGALTDVECGLLEIIGEFAFSDCISLRSINLPSARIVGEHAFNYCKALTNAKFGSKLERIEESAFGNCPSLERITIPLKIGIIPHDDTFKGCAKLMQVDLVEGEILRETIAALHLEEWRNDMIAEFDSIGAQILNKKEDKAGAIRNWMRQLLFKIEDYTTQHRHVLNEAATTLGLALWETSISECHNVIESVPTRAECRVLCGAEIVIKNVLPFLDLPPHTFEVCTDYDDEDDGWA